MFHFLAEFADPDPACRHLGWQRAGLIRDLLVHRVEVVDLPAASRCDRQAVDEEGRLVVGGDVDTDLLFQPLDILGKRKQRIAVADQAVGRTQAEYELARRQIVQRVKLTYWVARGAQEKRDLLNATVENFQEIVDYHSAQLSQGENGGLGVERADSDIRCAGSRT